MSRLYVDPYRYVCTECSSSRIKKRGKRGKHTGMGEVTHIYCRSCNTRLTAVYDKKKGVSVSYSTV